MKKKLKENCLIILIFFIVACVIYSAVNDFNVNMKKNKFRQEQMISECQNNINSSTDEKYIKYCNQLLEKKQELKIDFFSMLSDILVFKLRFLNATSFILLIVPTLINVCKILKNKYIYNFSTRGNYKEFIKMF